MALLSFGLKYQIKLLFAHLQKLHLLIFCFCYTIIVSKSHKSYLIIELDLGKSSRLQDSWYLHLV